MFELDRLVFGCGPIGSYASDGDTATGRAALAAALEAGIRHFDVAPSYGDGHAERLLGQALASIDESSVRVATKVGRTAMANANPYARPTAQSDPRGGGAFDFTALGVRAALRASLRRLQIDRVAIAFLHDPELAPDLVEAEALPALVELRDSGEVGAVGIATTNPSAAAALVETGVVEVVMIATSWTLTRRTAGEMLDLCHARGVTVHVAAPFDSGLLASSWPDARAPSGYRAATGEAIMAARAMATICDRHGVTLPQAALQFPLRHPAVSAVVCGMRSPEEVAADVGLLTEAVPEALWAELDAQPACTAGRARGGTRRSTP
jgi:D-threo-aldose 1-dehydrogenase